MALCALQEEVRAAPRAVSEAPLGEIRLQWWREAAAEIAHAHGDAAKVRAHPVVQAAARRQAVTPPALAALEAAIDARSALLYREPFQSVEAMFSWLDEADGVMARIRDLGAPPSIIRAESAFALAGDFAALTQGFLHPSLHEDARRAVNDAYADAKKALSELDGDAVVLHLHLALTPVRLASRSGPFEALMARWRLFQAMAMGRF